MMRQIVIIAHNLRSAHNVGSLLRTADGIGVKEVFLTGYTPYPSLAKDTRIPHEAAKLTRQIHKTALGAEDSLKWQANNDVVSILKMLRSQNYVLCALEQTDSSVSLPSYTAPDKVALLLGNEVSGLTKELISRTDIVLEIPMEGAKESYNVVQAAAMALYHLKYC